MVMITILFFIFAMIFILDGCNNKIYGFCLTFTNTNVKISHSAYSIKGIIQNTNKSCFINTGKIFMNTEDRIKYNVKNFPVDSTFDVIRSKINNNSCKTHKYGHFMFTVGFITLILVGLKIVYDILENKFTISKYCYNTHVIHPEIFNDIQEDDLTENESIIELTENETITEL